MNFDSEISSPTAASLHNQMEVIFAAILLLLCNKKKKYWNYYTVYTEEALIEQKTSKISDVCVKNDRTGDAVVIIEITRDLESDVEKVKYYRDIYDIKGEIFIYEYVEKVWYKIDEKGDEKKDDSWCEFFECDLEEESNKFIKK
ncbi:MAG: hypothetical protein IKP37_00670 [Paludibacteraceae bacterium]|nr:hypothetical protein [Paludibacteraceae bacterium]